MGGGKYIETSLRVCVHVLRCVCLRACVGKGLVSRMIETYSAKRLDRDYGERVEFPLPPQ